MVETTLSDGLQTSGLQNCIGPTIRISQEILCLPYAGFLKKDMHWLDPGSKFGLYGILGKFNEL